MKTQDEWKQIRYDIISKHITVTKSDSHGIESYFAFNEAMEEYALMKVAESESKKLEASPCYKIGLLLQKTRAIHRTKSKGILLLTNRWLWRGC